MTTHRANMPTGLADARLENRPWYVLTVPEGRELYARREVRALGHAAWLPMETRRVRDSRHGGKMRPVRVPVLPGYLFAAVAPGTDWRAMLDIRIPRLRIVDGAIRDDDGMAADTTDEQTVRGRWVRVVTGWLPVHAEPLAVPAREMAALFAIQAQWDADGSRGVLARKFRPGSRHEVMTGPLAGFVVTAEGMTSAGRVRAVITMLGGQVRAEFDAAMLEDAGS